MPRRLRMWGLAACAGVLMAATAHAATAIDFTTGRARDGVYHDIVIIAAYVRTVPHAVMGLEMSNAATEPATMMVLGTGLLAACRARRRQER